jgi:galactokinase
VPREVRAEPRGPAPREARAFAPGRVNLIGEHTDYNGGLALPFAIAEGVTVHARATGRPGIDAGRDSGAEPFVRGIATELQGAGVSLPDAELQIRGEVPQGAGLSSSAALAVALGLALLGLADTELDRRELARLCSRVENEWVGAHTGLLDQLASLFGEADTALCIDFESLAIEPVPLVLEAGWQLATVDSGERHDLASSGYNARRAECARACELLGIDTLRQARSEDPARLPDVLARRVRHVLEENARVRATVGALRTGDLARVGELLCESHVSLREQYECSTPAVEATVRQMRDAGAVGARMVGGGFGGSVLALFPPNADPPERAREVRPSRGAYLTRESSSATR